MCPVRFNYDFELDLAQLQEPEPKRVLRFTSCEKKLLTWMQLMTMKLKFQEKTSGAQSTAQAQADSSRNPKEGRDESLAQNGVLYSQFSLPEGTA